MRNLLALLFGAKLDPVTTWTAAIAVTTLFGVLVALRQLAGIRATSRADFTFRFIESFFTAETRTLFMLLINSALTFDVKEIAEDGTPIVRLPYLKISEAGITGHRHRVTVAEKEWILCARGRRFTARTFRESWLVRA